MLSTRIASDFGFYFLRKQQTLLYVHNYFCRCLTFKIILACLSQSIRILGNDSEVMLSLR